MTYYRKERGDKLIKVVDLISGSKPAEETAHFEILVPLSRVYHQDSWKLDFIDRIDLSTLCQEPYVHILHREIVTIRSKRANI